MTPHERVCALRKGGRVLRFHTQPLIGTQSVAEHSFHAAQLLLELCPTPSQHLLLAVLHHDLPEGFVGDVPFPSKRRFERLNQQLRLAEAEVAVELGVEPELTREEMLILNLVDLLECAYFAVDQAQLGHRGMTDVFKNCVVAVLDTIHTLQSLPEEERGGNWHSHSGLYAEIPARAEELLGTLHTTSSKYWED